MELLALHTRRRRGALLSQEPGAPERVPSNMESLGLTVAIKLLPTKSVVFIYTVLAGSAGGIILVAISTLGSPEETQTLTSFQRSWWAFCCRGGKKRVCKSLETVPNESDFCHQLNECAMDYWSMELDSKQKDTTEQFIPRTPKEKPNSVIFQNHGSKGTAQPCPRCIAGESGHFNHIMGF